MELDKFLQEALSANVDESALYSIMGTLEDLLTTSTSAGSNQNHINGAISNGGTVSSQKHDAIANSDTTNIVTDLSGKVAASELQNPQTVTNNPALINAGSIKVSDDVIGYLQSNQMMTIPIISSGILSPTSNSKTIQVKQPTLARKTNSAHNAQSLVTVPMTVAQSLVAVPMNVTASALRPGGILKYKLFDAKTVPPGSSGLAIAGGGLPLIFRGQTVPVATITAPKTSTTASKITVTPTVVTSAPVQTPANDNEKCRNFFATLIQNTTREHDVSVGRNIRSLIQDLLDMRVELDLFGDELSRLLSEPVNPCEIEFLRENLPSLRRSLVFKELTIDGISPPPLITVISLASKIQREEQNKKIIMLDQPKVKLWGRIEQNKKNIMLDQPKVRSCIRRPNNFKILSNTLVRPGTKPIVPSKVSKLAKKVAEKKIDDINDVVAMGGINFSKDTEKKLLSTGFDGTQITSPEEDPFLCMGPLQQKIRQVMIKYGFDEPEPSNEILAVISQAAQQQLKFFVEKLSVITDIRTEHAMERDSRYELFSDVRGQLNFPKQIDTAEMKKRKELERRNFMKIINSNPKFEDPELARLKEEAEIELAEFRERDTNETALQAIGTRRKPKLDSDINATRSVSRKQLPLKKRIKKVTKWDLQFLFETDKELSETIEFYYLFL